MGIESSPRFGTIKMLSGGQLESYICISSSALSYDLLVAEE